MEFSILMGVSHEELKAFVEAWPALNSDNEITQMTIQGSMNNLIGYPHGKFDLIQHDYDIDTAQISEVYQKATSNKSTPPSSLNGTVLQRFLWVNDFKGLAVAIPFFLAVENNLTMPCRDILSYPPKFGH